MLNGYPHDLGNLDVGLPMVGFSTKFRGLNGNVYTFSLSPTLLGLLCIPLKAGSIVADVAYPLDLKNTSLT